MHRIHQDSMDFEAIEVLPASEDSLTGTLLFEPNGKSLDLELTPNNYYVKIKGEANFNLNEMKQLQKWIDQVIKQMRVDTE